MAIDIWLSWVSIYFKIATSMRIPWGSGSPEDTQRVRETLTQWYHISGWEVPPTRFYLFCRFPRLRVGELADKNSAILESPTISKRYFIQYEIFLNLLRSVPMVQLFLLLLRHMQLHVPCSPVGKNGADQQLSQQIASMMSSSMGEKKHFKHRLLELSRTSCRWKSLGRFFEYYRESCK